MTFSEDEIDRYARHLVLAEIGGPGQQALKRASVLVVGCGGVGGPAALYLAAAGVGRIGLIDPDVVAISNLQRQIQFSTADVGAAKANAAARGMHALNPHVLVDALPEPLTKTNAASTIARYDLVLDGTDDFAVRHAVNRACVEAGKPLVSGALGRWAGQVAVFEARPCYACLVPETPTDADTCARVGVVGALAGVIGSMAALEAIKRITGAGEPLAGRMMIYDGLKGVARTVHVAADPACPVCA